MKKMIFVTMLAILSLAMSSAHAQEEESTTEQPLFDKYGGYPTVKTVVSQAATALLADPITAPFFVTVGKRGHDSADRLLSCLDLQFSAVLGGPYTYPGVSHFRNAPPQGYACKSMKKAHTGLKITDAAFDRFVTIVAGVLKKDGVSDADIDTVAPMIVGLKSQIVGR